MTTRPPEDHEPRDDTAVMPTPGPGRPDVAPTWSPPTDAPVAADVVPLMPSGQGSGPPDEPRPAYQPAPVHPAYRPQPVTHAYGPPVPARPAVGGGHVAVAWVVAVLSLGYMLPWAVAATRGRSNTLAIALVNLLVGWTFIGWVAALVMACLSDAAPTGSPTFVQVNAAAPAVAPPGWSPDGRGGSQYWDGRGWAAGPR